MAGDWIKMRADLQTHPKVVRIMSALKADRLRVVGGLHAVWCLFDVHSVDGTLDGYTADALDSLIGWPGFAAAMMAVGWLEETGETLTTPRFDEHNGQSAKRRAQETERKRLARADEKMSADDADKKRTREEKRREEEKEDMSGYALPMEILSYLNNKTQSNFQPVAATLSLIAGRLKEGATLEQCKSVIDLKVKTWLGDQKMEQYLRPKTLFNATNFANYVGELKKPTLAASGGYVDPRFKGAK